MSLEYLFNAPQFSIAQAEKEKQLLEELNSLTELHKTHCDKYSKILNITSTPPYSSLSDIPFLPVSLFKTNELRSIPAEEVFKVMTSSGTTGQAVSRIYIDRHTADLQSRALAAIMTSVLGSNRLPMLIVDTPSVVRNNLQFSARTAGVLGMFPFGRKHTYVLDDDMRLDETALKTFADKFSGQPILIFGFTFMVWKYFLQELRLRNIQVDLSHATLIHSGGWKKLTDEAVGNDEFRASFKETTGLTKIHNFYGMVEQVGSIFMEGDDGFLYPPNFADVIVRDPLTWEPAPHGTPGVVEVLSVLPHSYPGHALLTEDLGVIEGVADSSSGWQGKKLHILGRVPRSELRGCSDTHAFSKAS